MFVGVPEPQVWHPSRGIADLVAGGPAALGLGAPGQQGGPHWGDGRGARRVEAELDHADRGRVGVELVVGGDLSDPSREVDVLLGHPLDDVFGALVVAVDGVVADQLDVDIPLPMDTLGWWPSASPASPTAATNRAPVPKSSMGADSDDRRNTRRFEELRWQAEVGRGRRHRPSSASSTPR
jgi:hypothetical protein